MKTIIRKLLWSLSTVICLVSSAHATDIKVFASYLTDASYQWQTAAEKSSVANFLKDNQVDFGYFCGPKAVEYFPFTTDSEYSITNKQVVQAYGGIHVFAWRTEKYDLEKRYDPVQIGFNGKADACVFRAKDTGDMFAMIAPTETNFNRFQQFSSYIDGITNEYPGVMVFVGTTESFCKPHPGVEEYLNNTLGYLGSKQGDDCGGIYTPAVDGVSIVSQASYTIGTIAKEQGVVACVRCPSSFAVRFLDWDDSELKVEIVPEHGSVTPPADPERSGHEFIGWDHPAEDFADVTNSFVTHAQYKLLDTNFMVTFVDWDNSTNEQVAVTKNTPVARPDDPIRPYYSFRAWMNGDEDWDFADVVASNLTLKADYTLDAVQNIANADELSAVLAAGLPDSVVIRLTNDISFAGTDYTAADFAGILDGNGHYITGLPNNGKLFVTLSGTVHDLTVKDIGDGTAIAEYGGVFASKAMGASVYNCVLENANRSHNTANVKCGGFFYESRAGEDGHKTVISNCVVRDCKILTPYARDSQYVGGIAAVATDTDFIDCRLVATGADTVDIGGMATVAGGIVGNVGANSSVVRCSAEGIVEARRSVGYEWSGAGGIIGSVTAGIEISCCTNKARIVSVSGSGAGGIVGRVYASNPVIVKSSCNRGEIVQGEGSAPGRGNGVGGIVGGSYYNLTTCIIDCVNYGSVTAVDRAGGLIGCADSGGMTSTRLVVSNSFNYASVSAEHAAGGVVGRLYGSANSVIRNCGNAGAVSCPTNAAGGVVGLLNIYGNTTKLNIDGMMQAGTVSTDTGFVSLGVGILYGITWVSCSVEFTSAVFAGSASATGSGQVGSLCGGVFATENTKPFTVSADENCRLLGEYAAEYYDYTGTPQSLEISSMTAEDLVSKCGSVRILNDNASSKGYAPWVRAQDYPELAMFGTPWGTAAGAIIIFR